MHTVCSGYILAFPVRMYTHEWHIFKILKYCGENMLYQIPVEMIHILIRMNTGEDVFGGQLTT
jgi:hypothetical protein